MVLHVYSAQIKLNSRKVFLQTTLYVKGCFFLRSTTVWWPLHDSLQRVLSHKHTEPWNKNTLGYRTIPGQSHERVAPSACRNSCACRSRRSSKIPCDLQTGNIELNQAISQSINRVFSFDKNCVLHQWESETLK